MRTRSRPLVLVGLAILWLVGSAVTAYTVAAVHDTSLSSATSHSPQAQPQKQKPKDNGDLVVYVTKTGSKYHAAGCSSLRKSAIPMTLREATKRYGPCKNCRPPVYQVYK